tara:strand:+ start:283 stop:423 length:141 start_codon:yes stop_codon:yes gene_type:complete
MPKEFSSGSRDNCVNSVDSKNKVDTNENIEITSIDVCNVLNLYFDL